ncbi:hypothetical protein CW304_22115 [Bacillus sp. UFRGS-B20]|nr:hypothetical protein CW304_22115 [Bacillus sp. UFRGS-B20]
MQSCARNPAFLLAHFSPVLSIILVNLRKRWALHKSRQHREHIICFQPSAIANSRKKKAVFPPHPASFPRCMNMLQCTSVVLAE